MCGCVWVFGGSKIGRKACVGVFFGVEKVGRNLVRQSSLQQEVKVQQGTIREARAGCEKGPGVSVSAGVLRNSGGGEGAEPGSSPGWCVEFCGVCGVCSGGQNFRKKFWGVPNFCGNLCEEIESVSGAER